MNNEGLCPLISDNVRKIVILKTSACLMKSCNLLRFAIIV